MSSIPEYLDKKNIQYKREGNECIIICPGCRKEKLYINTTTQVFQCFVCKAENPDSKYAKGHFSQLQKDFGDLIDIVPIKTPKKNNEDKDFTTLTYRYHNALINNKKGLKYLYKRGFSDDDIKYFKFGYLKMKDEEWISIPAFKGKIPKLLKYRKITDNTDTKKYEREFGSNSILFNEDILLKYDDIFLTEGEFDAATLIKNGYENTVGLTGGAGTLLPEWYDELILKSNIYIVCDGDKAGQNSAEHVYSKRLGINKCWNIELPEGEDVNSFFVKYTKEEFDKLIKNAIQFKVDGISPLGEILYNMGKTENIVTYSLPWDSVNRLIGGGLRKTHLTVIGARAGIGKTSLSIQIAYHFGKVHKIPSMVFCMEMNETALATKIVQIALDLDYDDIDYTHGPSYAMELEELPIYFGYSGSITPEIYYNTVKQTRNRYGCELFVFDNLQLMVVSDSEADFSAATKMFKRIAMELGVMMILISQPTKIGSERVLNYEDLKGSSALSQDPDEIILLNRRRILDVTGLEAFESKTSVIVDKSRVSSGGRTYLEMIGPKSKFIEWRK